MNLDDLPIGMVKLEDLLNLLLALQMAGQDTYTLECVAQATGLLEHFENKKVTRCSIVIEQKEKLLLKG